MDRRSKLIKKLTEDTLHEIALMLTEARVLKQVSRHSKPSPQSSEVEFDPNKGKGKSSKRTGHNPSYAAFGHDPNEKIETDSGYIKVPSLSGKKRSEEIQRLLDIESKGGTLSPDERVRLARWKAKQRKAEAEENDPSVQRIKQYGKILKSIHPNVSLDFEHPDKVEVTTGREEIRLGETLRITTYLISVDLVPMLMDYRAPLIYSLASLDVGGRISTHPEGLKDVKEVTKITPARAGHIEDTIFELKSILDSNGEDVSEDDLRSEEDLASLAESRPAYHPIIQVGSRWFQRDNLYKTEQNKVWNLIPGTVKENLRKEVKQAIAEYVQSTWRDAGYARDEGDSTGKYSMATPSEPVVFVQDLGSSSQTSKVEYSIKMQVTFPPYYSTASHLNEFFQMFNDFDENFGTDTGAFPVPRHEKVAHKISHFASKDTIFSQPKGRWQTVIMQEAAKYVDKFIADLASKDSDYALDVKLALANLAVSNLPLSNSATEEILHDALAVAFMPERLADGSTRLTPRHLTSDGGSDLYSLAKQSGGQWAKRMSFLKLFDLLTKLAKDAEGKRYKGFLHFMRTITSGGKYSECGDSKRVILKGTAKSKVGPYQSPNICTKYIKALIPVVVGK